MKFEEACLWLWRVFLLGAVLLALFKLAAIQRDCSMIYYSLP